MTVRVNRVDRIRAKITVPADKSISHRALILNAIADGRAEIENLLDSADVRSTARCLAELGVEIDWPDGSSSARVKGGGLHGLWEARDVLDCGNSGTTMRLLSGLLAAHPILSILTGDESLRSRPMARVIQPLRRMGASIQARTGDTLAPIVIRGGNLQGIAYQSPMASAQVKSAILLAGLYAEGRTEVREPAKSRDHTERMLASMGVPAAVDGAAASVEPVSRLEPLGLRVPGDISSAAPWLVLGACHPDAEIAITGVNTNPSRTGVLDILRAMGADIDTGEERVVGGEQVADLVVRSSRLRGTEVSGDLVPRAIDELPLIGLAACFAEGETVVRDAAELVVKESNRVELLASVLGSLGARVTTRPDGFVVHGPAPLTGHRVDASSDHRIGMLAAIAGALAVGETRIENAAVEVSYPSFFTDLQAAAGDRTTA